MVTIVDHYRVHMNEEMLRHDCSRPKDSSLGNSMHIHRHDLLRDGVTHHENKLLIIWKCARRWSKLE